MEGTKLRYNYIACLFCVITTDYLMSLYGKFKREIQITTALAGLVNYRIKEILEVVRTATVFINSRL